jgi:hypothetical protein
LVSGAEDLRFSSNLEADPAVCHGCLLDPHQNLIPEIETLTFNDREDRRIAELDLATASLFVGLHYNTGEDLPDAGRHQRGFDEIHTFCFVLARPGRAPRVEWRFWEGPASCAPSVGVASAVDMLDQIENTHAPSCTDAPWRLFGLSFAGWNVLVSALLLALGAYGASLAWRRG